MVNVFFMVCIVAGLIAMVFGVIQGSWDLRRVAVGAAGLVAAAFAFARQDQVLAVVALVLIWYAALTPRRNGTVH